MPRFEIHRCRNPRDGSHGPPIRTLEIEGATAGAEPRPARAILVFSPDLDAGRPPPTVGYVTESDGDGIAIVGWFPGAAFDGFRRALTGDAARHVQYEFRDAGAAVGYLRRIGIGGRDGALAAEAGARRAGAGRPAFAMPL